MKDGAEKREKQKLQRNMVVAERGGAEGFKNEPTWSAAERKDSKSQPTKREAGGRLSSPEPQCV